MNTVFNDFLVFKKGKEQVGVSASSIVAFGSREGGTDIQYAVGAEPFNVLVDETFEQVYEKLAKVDQVLDNEVKGNNNSNAVKEK